MQALTLVLKVAPYIELVTSGSVGLQVMVRRSTSEATSELVMFALHQILLWKKNST